METQTLETSVPVTTEVQAPAATAAPAAPVGEGEASPDLAVAVDGVEVAVTDTEGGLELTPATGLVGVVVLALLAFAVLKLRKR
jgi:hypothetical protein